MDDKKKELMIKYASTISWTWGIIYLLIFVLVLIAAIISNSLKDGILYVGAIFMFAFFYSVVGWGLRRLAKWAGYFILFISGINILASAILLFRDPQAAVPLIISGAMFILVLLGWKVLK